MAGAVYLEYSPGVGGTAGDSRSVEISSWVANDRRFRIAAILAAQEGVQRSELARLRDLENGSTVHPSADDSRSVKIPVRAPN